MRPRPAPIAPAAAPVLRPCRLAASPMPRAVAFMAVLMAVLMPVLAAATTLSVGTLPAAIEDSYEVERAYIGRVEARQRSAVGFELGGTVEAVLAEEGDAVDRGAAIARLDTARLKARRREAVAERDAAQANLVLARQTLARTEKAIAKRAVSEQQLDEAEQAVAARAAERDRADARIAAIDVDLAKSKLAAPYDALVAARHMDAGQVAAAGAPALTLIERAAPEVRIGVAGDDAGRLKTGAAHRLLVGAERPETVAATVKAVLPVRNAGRRTVDAVFVLDAALDGIRPGDIARWPVARTVAAEGAWLPLTALTESARGLWACYVAVPLAAPEGAATHMIERRELEMLHARAETAYVRGALSEGEKVVSEGVHRLTPGLKVRLAGPDA